MNKDSVNDKNKMSYLVCEEIRLTEKLVILQQENTALTTQLEDLKGKLVMMDTALVEIGSFVVCGDDEYKKKVIHQIINIAHKARKALSSDIQRYREEIEREAIQRCIALISDFDPYYPCGPTAPPMITHSEAVKALESLLPIQKEVSDR